MRVRVIAILVVSMNNLLLSLLRYCDDKSPIDMSEGLLWACLRARCEHGEQADHMQ